MPQIPPNSTESLGVVLLKSRGVFPEARWYWIGVGALIGYTLLFNFLFTLALKYLNREYLHLHVQFWKLSPPFWWLNWLQHSGSPRQCYQKRPWLKEMPTELEILLNCQQEERALQVSHMTLLHRYVAFVSCMMQDISWASLKHCRKRERQQNKFLS